MKEKVCDLCRGKTKGNFSPDATLICWKCTNKLLNTPEEKIRQVIVTLKERGNLKRATLLEGFIGKEKSDAVKVSIGTKGTHFSGHRGRSAYGAGFGKST